MNPAHRLVLLILALTLAPGCSVGPRFQKPQPDMPSDFASRAQARHIDTLDTAWWRKLGDSTLNQLIDQAASANKDLAATQSRLQEARALWREARLDYAPTVTSSASYENTLNGATAFGAGFRGRSFELYRAGFDADWELDFFGRVRNSVKAARATSDTLQADLDDLLLTVTAEVAINYLELRGAQAQLAVARDNATIQAESLRIAEASLKGGRGTQLDVARASTQWNATQAQIPLREETIARSIHRIAVLCGRPPSELRPSLSTPKALPKVPASIAITRPADLLRRRPDIRAAEFALEAETARIGIATADLFPRVTFNGRLNIEASTPANLTAGDAEAFSFGPRLTWAAFNLGRVRQQIAAAGHRADAALSRYEQTVLLALEEAENALTTYDRERVRLRLLEAAATSAQEAATLARQLYQDVTSDFLSVVDAQRVSLAAQDEIVLSRTRAITAWIGIHKALGGTPQ
jgi:multidrug efflux system outer membrane protein